jgi:hypothetical protein
MLGFGLLSGGSSFGEIGRKTVGISPVIEPERIDPHARDFGRATVENARVGGGRGDAWPLLCDSSGGEAERKP